MKALSTLAMAISLIFAAPAYANDEHHPEKAPAGKTATAPADASIPATVEKMQRNVKKMQAQLDRVGQAKTDEARQKAMAEHLQTMQENMHLARAMQDGVMDCESMHGAMMGKAEAPERMKKMEMRLEMMEQMMNRQGGSSGQTPAK